VERGFSALSVIGGPSERSSIRARETSWRQPELAVRGAFLTQPGLRAWLRHEALQIILSGNE
jgi:hypothetical protein